MSAQRFSLTIQFSDPSKSGTYLAGGGDFSELTRLEDGTWERRYPDGTVVSFDTNGLQTAITDTNGNTKSYTYGVDGRLATITDEIGDVTSFAYQADGRLGSIAYPDGRVSTFEYDDLGAMTEMAGSDGSERRYSYNENGQMIGATDPNGNQLQYRYNDAGAYSGATYPNGTEIGFRPGETIGLEELNTAAQPLPYYPPEERMTLQTDERGGVSQITLNEYGSIVETIDPLGRYVRYERDEENLVVAIERPTQSPAPIDEASLGWGFVGTAFAGVPIPQEILDLPVRRDEMEYDVNGNMIVRRQAVGTTLVREERFEYDLDTSRLMRHVDEEGFETSFTYDAYGNMATVADAEGNSIAYTYNDKGLTESYTDERGFVTSYTYNQFGNVETATLPDGTVYRRVYDTSGNVVQEIEAEGTPQQRTLVQAFDAYNRLLNAEVLDANGLPLDGQMQFAYDAGGNKVSETDEIGIETRYVYDAMNKLFFVETPGYGRTTYFRDAANDVTAIVDAEDAQHLFEYDAVGRLIGETDAEGNESTYHYDVYDNLTQVFDGRGNVTTFAYDVFNRQIARTNPLGQTSTTAYDARDNLTGIARENGDAETASYDGLSRRVGVTTPDNVVRYQYDASGNLLAANDNDSGLSFTYDNRDRLITATTDGTVGPQPGIMLSYGYDALGQRQSLSDSLGGTWSYGFDEKSRVTAITAPWGDVHNMDYDPAGRRTQLTNQSGRQTLAAYADDRLSQLEHFMSGAPVARSGFDYAADGQISLLRDLEDITASRSLQYDTKNQLIQVAQGTPVADGGAPIPVEDYAYDAVGNRTESTSSLDYVVDDHNRLLETSDYLYAYDTKGNRTTRTRKSDGRVESYVYNSMNQLTEVTSTEGLVARYAYDALGRRIAKTVNGTVTAYVHDISDMADVTTHDRLLEFVNGDLTTRWLHGQNIDEAVGFERYTGATIAGSGQAYALHADRQGSPVAVTDQATGTVVSRYNYDAFGARELEAGSELMDVGFTGREYDGETDLYHYRARAYDPDVGRFVQSDPIGFAAGDLNLYVYTWNDPSNWSDPSGLAPSVGKSVLTAGVVGMAIRAVGKIDRLATIAGATYCLANNTASLIRSLARNVQEGNWHVADAAAPITRIALCASIVKMTKTGCGCGVGAGSSFVSGTEVLTPAGRVSIEVLREGDIVISRDSVAGEFGEYQVTALMARQAPSVVWLTLRTETGEASKLGVTGEHPLFVAGKGWTEADQILIGDQVRDAGLGLLNVVDVNVDHTPQQVHNLEVGGAATYFVGELDAWGHNSSLSPTPSEAYENAQKNNDGKCGCGCGLDVNPSSDNGPNGATRQHRIPQTALKILGVPQKLRDRRPNVAKNAWRRQCNSRDQARGKKWARAARAIRRILGL